LMVMVLWLHGYLEVVTGDNGWDFIV